MEVHHSHQEHPGRKLKDYFYEFFMLFLAVTAGFIVENLRENYVERHREKEYIESLIEDIKSDTLAIQETIKRVKYQVEGVDSLLKIMEKPILHDFKNKLYYYSLKYLGSATYFEHTDRTISQLKNTGGLRLIQKTGASDSIITYYSTVYNSEYNGEFNMKLYDKILTYGKEMFDFKYIQIYKIDQFLSTPGLVMLNDNPNFISKYYNEVLFYNMSIKGYANLLNTQKVKAKSLISFLKKSYNLE